MALKIERFQPEGMNVRMSGEGLLLPCRNGERHRQNLFILRSSWLAIKNPTVIVSERAICAPQIGADLPKPRPLPQGSRRHLG